MLGITGMKASATVYRRDGSFNGVITEDNLPEYSKEGNPPIGYLIVWLIVWLGNCQMK
jgi:hypothetical protein